MKKELIKYLNRINGSIVCYSRAGGGANSVILIEFNQNFMFVVCAWRITQGNKVIATSADDTTAETGTVAKGAKMLEGKKVLSVEVFPFYDLQITFEDDFCLKLFCDINVDNILSASKNWDFSIPDENLSFTITKNYQIEKGKCDSND